MLNGGVLSVGIKSFVMLLTYWNWLVQKKVEMVTVVKLDNYVFILGNVYGYNYSVQAKIMPMRSLILYQY